MALTGRLQMTLRSNPDSMATGATDLTNNYLLIDTNVGAPQYTTTQRLALTPYTGQTVYDTTLNRSFYYDGTTWRYWSQVFQSRGVLGQKIDGSLVNFSTETKIHQVTFRAVQNRRYMIVASYSSAITTANNGRVGLNFRWAQGTTVATTDTLLNGPLTFINSASTTSLGGSFVAKTTYQHLLTDRQIAIGVFGLDLDNTMSLDSGIPNSTTQGAFMVHDIGGF
jgi:hypothetical protein